MSSLFVKKQNKFFCSYVINFLNTVSRQQLFQISFLTFSSRFNVVAKNRSFPRVPVGPGQFDSTDRLGQDQVPGPARTSDLRSGRHVTDDRRTVIECLRPDRERVRDLLLEVVDEQKTLGHSLFHLFRVIWKKREFLWLTIVHQWL